MIFSGTEFITQEGTTTITLKQKKEIFEYPYSGVSEVINKGKSPVKITTVAITFTETEMKSLINNITLNQPATLQIGDSTYNNVILDEEVNLAAVSKDKKGRYNIALRFVVLSPSGSAAGTGVNL